MDSFLTEMAQLRQLYEEQLAVAPLGTLERAVLAGQVSCITRAITRYMLHHPPKDTDEPNPEDD